MSKPRRVLIVGSGPIIIGQAAEFDYSGTQACLALREEGVKTILVNSNPATIQTDHEVADTVYLEPLTPSFVAEIIKKERPDGLIATVGGQTGLNLAIELHRKGILDAYNVDILGTSIQSICQGENRGLFKKLMGRIHQPILPGEMATSVASGLCVARSIGFPLIMRSSFNLGGTGSGLIHTEGELEQKLLENFSNGYAHDVLLEKSIVGWAEIEYEMIRDERGNTLMVCTMENIDPMGVHTGESIVVAPSQTLSDEDHQCLRSAAFCIVAALDIRGSCNIQFALNQRTGEYYVIEVNPRLSRSSALASKATGYPIARVSAKIAIGKALPEIVNNITGKTAFFEPTLDYIVVKIPRWPDDKFITLDRRVGVTMKATGETMAIGRSFEEAMAKAIESLDLKDDLYCQYQDVSLSELKRLLKTPHMRRLGAICSAFSRGISVRTVHRLTDINSWFLEKFSRLVQRRRAITSLISVYKMVDTCAGEFEAHTPYFYSTHGTEDEAMPLPGPKVIILGSGPIRIGQGIEFDYLTVHAVKALKEIGIKAIVINNNPETVSTDYSISDRLYFEPLTLSFVERVVKHERNGLCGIIPQFGGQTAISLAVPLSRKGYSILGTPVTGITASEDRRRTAAVIHRLGYAMPTWRVARNRKDILKMGNLLNLPILARPSFVLGGEGMAMIHTGEELRKYGKSLPPHFLRHPILFDEFIDRAMEIDVDVISDGTKTMSFILEQLDQAGIHSGDSRCVFPPQRLSPEIQERVHRIATDVSGAFGIVGLGNIQLAVRDHEIFVLEVNPRASRTIPFLSKCLGISLANIATRVIAGHPLPELNLKSHPYVSIKNPVFSFDKLVGVSQTLEPLMKSTGETMTIGRNFAEALRKTTAKEKDDTMGIYPLW